MEIFFFLFRHFLAYRQHLLEHTVSDMLRRDSGFQWRLCVESIWSGKSKPTGLESQKPDDEIEKGCGHVPQVIER